MSYYYSMDDNYEALPLQESALLKIDTLSAIHRHGEEIKAMVFLMDDDLTKGLIREMSESQRLPKIDYNHPFGYYQIPIMTVDFEPEISAPVDIQFVSDKHPSLNKRPNTEASEACYDPSKKTIYLRESHFTPASRLLGWIGLGLLHGATYEEVAEHEIRHAIFGNFLKGPFGGGISNISEGFAWATAYEPSLDAESISFMSEMILNTYTYHFYDPRKIAEYCQLFTMVQAKGIDEVKLLQHMERKAWWAEFGEEWDLSLSRIRTNVLQHIGAENIEALAEQEGNRRKHDMLNFRYGVWKHTLGFLKKNGLAPNIDWQEALLEEKKVREGWDEFRAAK